MFMNSFLHVFKDELEKQLRKKIELDEDELLHLDMFKMSMLFGHFIFYARQLFNKDLLSNKNIDDVIDIIYNENIQKIRELSMGLTYKKLYNILPLINEEVITEDSNYYDYINDLQKIASDEYFAKKVIVETIEQSINEMGNFVEAYKRFANDPQNNKIKVPVSFFFNCFVHPHILINNKNFIYFGYRNYINRFTVEIFTEISIFFPKLIKYSIEQNR